MNRREPRPPMFSPGWWAVVRDEYVASRTMTGGRVLGLEEYKAKVIRMQGIKAQGDGYRDEMWVALGCREDRDYAKEVSGNIDGQRRRHDISSLEMHARMEFKAGYSTNNLVPQQLNVDIRHLAAGENVLWAPQSLNGFTQAQRAQFARLRSQFPDTFLLVETGAEARNQAEIDRARAWLREKERDWHEGRLEQLDLAIEQIQQRELADRQRERDTRTPGREPLTLAQLPLTPRAQELSLERDRTRGHLAHIVHELDWLARGQEKGQEREELLRTRELPGRTRDPSLRGREPPKLTVRQAEQLAQDLERIHGALARMAERARENLLSGQTLDAAVVDRMAREVDAVVAELDARVYLRVRAQVGKDRIPERESGELALAQLAVAAERGTLAPQEMWQALSLSPAVEERRVGDRMRSERARERQELRKTQDRVRGLHEGHGHVREPVKDQEQQREPGTRTRSVPAVDLAERAPAHEQAPAALSPELDAVRRQLALDHALPPDAAVRAPALREREREREERERQRRAERER